LLGQRSVVGLVMVVGLLLLLLLLLLVEEDWEEGLERLGSEREDLGLKRALARSRKGMVGLCCWWLVVGGGELCRWR